ncbi:MAG: hypothetical protein FWE05_02990 [Defluviitaleaceae bacterium]|nr:hypothetical protein [Defluviitaleaceae bacterium]
MSSRVNIPVIFILIGCEDFLPVLSMTLHHYVEGTKHILIANKVNEVVLKAEIERIWRELMSENIGNSDIVRCNYILRTDEHGIKLPLIKKTMEKYLYALYPAGVLTDIYCLLNDTNFLEDSKIRREVVELIKAEEIQRSYMLSNLTSMNTLISSSDIAQTIALLTLFKDCESDFYTADPDASRYNEFFFLENCTAGKGCFLTASSTILTLPQNALKALIITELLYYGKNKPVEHEPSESSIGIIPTLSEMPKAPVPSLAYLYGLAIPKVSRNDTLTRQQWISRLFGLRLESILDEQKNIKQPIENKAKISIEGHNLFDLLRYTSEDGFFAKNINQSMEVNGLSNAEAQHQHWMNEVPNFTKNSAKRRLSLLVKQDLWHYELASVYINKRIELEYLREKASGTTQYQEIIKNLHHKLQNYLDKINDIAKSYEKDICQLTDVFSMFTKNAEHYFRQKFNDYALNHQSELAKISKKMTTYLSKNKLSDYIIYLEKYVDEHIMPHFNQSIEDILNDFMALDGSGNKAVTLGEWALKNKFYSVRLKVGYTGLYTEANLFMPKAYGEDVKKYYEGRGFGRMNLFAKANANCVAILYHAGSFNVEDFYYTL